MRRWLLAFLLVLLQGAAWAHKPSDSYLTVRTTEGSADLAVRWDIALRDLDYVLQLDRDGNGELSWGEVRQRSADITRYATERLVLDATGKPCAWDTTAPMQLDRHSDGTYAVLRLTARCRPLRPRSSRPFPKRRRPRRPSSRRLHRRCRRPASPPSRHSRARRHPGHR